ncbi:PHP domain-containing protein, partial [Micromonospora sp. D75]
MSFHNPKMPWSKLEQVLSGRAKGERHLHVVDPLAVDADGGDSPAWSRKRQEYRPPQMDRPDGVVPYAELHAHSNFSFLDGASHPEELAEEAARLGLTALA